MISLRAELKEIDEYSVTYRIWNGCDIILYVSIDKLYYNNASKKELQEIIFRQVLSDIYLEVEW